MNYIYDILLNFKDELYDFYDWNKSDNILHIRKIPIIKIATEDLLNIRNNEIKFDLNFLEKIRNKTEIFTSKNIKNLEYSFLLTDGSYIIAILRQDKKVKKSSLLVDEELDCLEEISGISISKIQYKIIKKEIRDELKTRKQNEMSLLLKKEINKIKNEEEKLKYIFYECFNVKEECIDKIVLKLMNNIEDINISKKLYNFFKLIEVHK